MYFPCFGKFYQEKSGNPADMAAATISSPATQHSELLKTFLPRDGKDFSTLTSSKY
jgi:hypothetical protein